MKILRSIKKLKTTISSIKNLGFIPTMGGLHDGHLSLINKCQKKCDKTLVSIYVNPKQFNNFKDFSKYPRNLNKDLKILKKQNVDFVFIPKTSEIYKKKRKKKLIVNNKKKILCGKFRRGHFEGVIDIIDRLLFIINPQYIFLGEKDFQQLFLIKKHVKKKFKVKVISCKTIRDNNFLALSSRNYLLSKKDLITAGKIAKKINQFKKEIKKNYKNKNNIIHIKKYLEENYPIKLDYLELRNKKNLCKIKKNNKFKVFLAYYINGVRLIDNY